MLIPDRFGQLSLLRFDSLMAGDEDVQVGSSVLFCQLRTVRAMQRAPVLMTEYVSSYLLGNADSPEEL
jgi:hypothetical protein